ncbi:MAG TPA: hypothetical protein VLM85_22035 [Polyangiaceae bacterium]|nr:hypothetical protein [Polyangiaceae bacterium]
MGWGLFCTLTAFAALDALGVAVLATRARVERYVVATAVFLALVGAPALALGYLEILTRPRLAVAALVLFAGTFVALSRAMPARTLLVECARAARAIAAIPVDALRECARVRSVVFIGVGWAIALMAYALFEAWRVPNAEWDALIYHEPIIGFALQNHGFATMWLPPNATLQAINGYPRLCEMTALWFVAFTDRTLVELPNVLSYPALVAAAYLLFRRFTDRVSAMGLAAVLAFMPQIWSQICLVENDVEVALFAVTALHFATRPTVRVRDAWCVWLAAGLLVASKGSGLAIAAAVGIVVSVRLVVRLRRTRRAAVASSIAAGALLVAAVGCVPYLRNWREYHNPLWPVTVQVSALGIDWKGILTLREIVTDQPFRDTFRSYYENPGTGLVDLIRHGFGYAIPWVVFPLAAIGVVVVLTKGAFALLGRTRGPRLENLGWVVALGLVFTLTTPTLGRNARYNIHILVCMMTLVAWLLSSARWQRLREGALGASLVLSVMPLFWMNDWLWSWGAAQDTSFLRHPFGSRSHLEHPHMELLAKARDDELHEGDVAAVDQEVLFIGAMWNFEFSNEVKVVQCGADARAWLSDLDTMNAKWVAAGSEQARRALDASRRWERVGKMTSEDETLVYRRVSP